MPLPPAAPLIVRLPFDDPQVVPVFVVVNVMGGRTVTTALFDAGTVVVPFEIFTV